MRSSRSGGWSQLDVEFPADCSGRSFNLIQPRFVVEIKQPVHLRTMHAELAGEIGLAGPGFDHGAIKLELCCYDGGKGDQALPTAGSRWSRNFLARRNAALQRRGHGIGNADERIGSVLTESGDFRQIGSSYED